MCNGANLGFSRYDFEILSGYDQHKQISSGDDVLLMHAYESNDTTGSVGFVKPEEPLVRTEAEPTLLRLYHQRKRWAGKWKAYKQAEIRWFAIAVFLMNFAWVGVSTWLILTLDLPTFSVLIVGKLLLETVLLFKLRSYFQFTMAIAPLIILSVIYPFYVVFFGVVSHFGSYNWKGRSLRN